MGNFLHERFGSSLSANSYQGCSLLRIGFGNFLAAPAL
jgi:hypothetical protein